jgi:molecular chaperone DnaK
LGDKVEGGERSAIESAISDLRTAAKSDNKSAIEAKTRALGDLSGKLAERLYSQAGGGPEGGSGGPHGGPGGPGGHGHKPADDGVVDAEFEEVKK